MTDAPSSQPPTVFVVDDDASVRKALARLFASLGLAVETFAGTAELSARNPRGEHGCIVLDIKMPGKTGIEFQRELKAADVALPIVFLSAHANVPISVQAMKDGAIDVITKPFEEQTLIDAVRRALSLDESRRQDDDRYQEIRQRFERLTPRQQTVMTFVVTGKLNKEVAALLGTSVKTVKVHRGHVMKKMQASSLPDLVRMADRIRLPAVPDGVPKVQ